MVSFDSVVVASENQVYTELADEVVILDTDKGIYYSLNPVGAFIWRKMLEPTPVKALHDAVLAEFEVDSEQCRQDVLRLLEDLSKQGLIDVRDA